MFVKLKKNTYCTKNIFFLNYKPYWKKYLTFTTITEGAVETPHDFCQRKYEERKKKKKFFGLTKSFGKLKITS